MTIVINGTEHEWSKAFVTYEEVAKLAGISGRPTINYEQPRRSRGMVASRELVPNGKVKVHNMTEFDVDITGGA